MNKKTKKCAIKRKLKLQDYKNCLKSAETERKIIYLKKIWSLYFVKNNELILKTQQKFKSERHNALTEEINKIALSSNDDKRTPSIHSMETYAYGTSKGLRKKKERKNYM